jgi:hypothetical protein
MTIYLPIEIKVALNFSKSMEPKPVKGSQPAEMEFRNWGPMKNRRDL